MNWEETLNHNQFKKKKADKSQTTYNPVSDRILITRVIIKLSSITII